MCIPLSHDRITLKYRSQCFDCNTASPPSDDKGSNLMKASETSGSAPQNNFTVRQTNIRLPFLSF